MFSYEISNILASNNYNIDSKTYLEILESPQISGIKYNSFENSFEIWDGENNCWKFKGVKQGIPLASADGRNGEIINKTENI